MTSLTFCVNVRVKKGLRYLASSFIKPFTFGLAKLISRSSSVSSDKCSESTVSPYGINSETNGPRQVNLVLIAYASREGSGEPAHPSSLARTSAARSYKQ